MIRFWYNRPINIFRNEAHMKTTALLLMAISVGSKVLGFVRELVLSYFYGTSSIKDAYVIAITVPFALFGFVATALQTGIIPVYNQVETKEGKKAADDFIANSTNVVFIIATAVVIGVILFTKPIVLLFAKGFTGETLELAIKFTRIIIFTVYATGVSAIFQSYMNIHQDFVTPSTTPFIMNIIAIVAVVLSAKTHVYILIIGTLAANVLQYTLFPKRIRALDYTHKRRIDFKDPHLKQMVIITMPLIVAIAANSIGVIIDKNIASSIVEGGISALDYANKLLGLVTGVVVTSMVTSIYPTFSKLGAEGDLEALKEKLIEALSMTCLLVIPSVFGLMALSEPVISFVFGRGEFGQTSIAMTSSALFYYAPFLIGYALRDVTMRGFYALGDTKTPVFIAVVLVAVDVVFNVILSKFMGLDGLALATTIGSSVGGVMIIVAFRKKVGRLGLQTFIVDCVKITFCSVLMGLCARGVHDLLYATSPTLGLLVGIAVGVVVYGVGVVALKVESLNEGLALIKSKYNKEK